jgi:hypothetical protein
MLHKMLLVQNLIKRLYQTTNLRNCTIKAHKSSQLAFEQYLAFTQNFSEIVCDQSLVYLWISFLSKKQPVQKWAVTYVAPLHNLWLVYCNPSAACRFRYLDFLVRAWIKLWFLCLNYALEWKTLLFRFVETVSPR